MRTKENATLDIHVSDKSGGNRRRLVHADLDLLPLEKMLGAPLSNKYIIAFMAMQTALKTSLQLPNDEKFLIWSAHAVRWNKLREGACAAMAKSDRVSEHGDFTPEDVGLMEMYVGGKYGNQALWNAQDHILRIMEGMDEETVAAFVEEFDGRWQALQDAGGAPELSVE